MDHEARRLAMRRMGRLDNFGIRQVERLDGNVGYLDVRRVAVPANAGPAIGAAMELVCRDLRAHHRPAAQRRRRARGRGLLVQLPARERPTHLNDIFHAETGETRQVWAMAYVPGTRYRTARSTC